MSSPPGQDDDTPFARQQRNFTFSGRVLLTAVVILAIITVIFVLIRLLLFHFVVRGRGGRGSLAAGIRRSFGRITSSRYGGLDAAALAALPVTAYHGPKGDNAGSSTSGGATDCAVCLSELADGEKVHALPACGHVFHVECVDAWLRSRTTCPVCRAEVAPPPKDATEAAPPALFGAGGTLVVTVQSDAAQPRTSTLGPGQRAVRAGYRVRDISYSTN